MDIWAFYSQLLRCSLLGFWTLRTLRPCRDDGWSFCGRRSARGGDYGPPGRLLRLGDCERQREAADAEGLPQVAGRSREFLRSKETSGRELRESLLKDPPLDPLPSAICGHTSCDVCHASKVAQATEHFRRRRADKNEIGKARKAICHSFMSRG